MATAVVSGIIDINNGGAPFDDLALKIYGGMVLEAFNKTTTTKGRHMSRTISSGKSAQFPVIGRVATGYHTRGTEITFEQVNDNERIISIGGLLLAPIFLDILDEAKTHFEVRRPLATQQGQALAEDDDLRVLQAIAVASRTATPNFLGGDGGVQYVNASVGTSASVLKAGIYSAAQTLDENSVVSTDRSVWLSPAQFYLLLQDGEFIDRDFNDNNGSRAKAVMRNAADFDIIKTTNMPSLDESANTDLPTNLQLDYTTTVGLCAHASAAGSLTLIGLSFETAWDPNRQGHMLIAKFAKGYDYLRPEASVELASA